MTSSLAARILPLLARSPLTIGQLAAALGMAPQSLGSPLASLQRRGLAERAPGVVEGWVATAMGREVVRAEEARRERAASVQAALFPSTVLAQTEMFAGRRTP